MKLLLILIFLSNRSKNGSVTDALNIAQTMLHPMYLRYTASDAVLQSHSEHCVQNV